MSPSKFLPKRAKTSSVVPTNLSKAPSKLLCTFTTPHRLCNVESYLALIRRASRRLQLMARNSVKSLFLQSQEPRFHLSIRPSPTRALNWNSLSKYVMPSMMYGNQLQSGRRLSIFPLLLKWRPLMFMPIPLNGCTAI